MPYDPNWKNTPGTQAPTPTPGAWNAGDVWDMNRAPQSVIDAMKKYAETHDDKYYQSQIPAPAGPLLTAPVITAPGTADWRTTPGTLAPTPHTRAWNEGDFWDMSRAPENVRNSRNAEIPETVAPSMAAVGSPVIPPLAITPGTIAPVIPPATSHIGTTPLVTSPTASAGQNELLRLRNLLGRSAVGGLGSFKMPNFFTQSQQKWGGFSPAAFSKR